MDIQRDVPVLAAMGWLLWGLVLFVISVVLIRFDLRSRRLPNAWVGLAIAAVVIPIAAMWPSAMGHSALGALVWAGSYLVIGAVMGQGIGGGDIKLALACGAAVGAVWESAAIPAVLGVMFLASALSVGVALWRPSISKSIPHGPSMLVATWLGALLGAPNAMSGVGT